MRISQCELDQHGLLPSHLKAALIALTWVCEHTTRQTIVVENLEVLRLVDMLEELVEVRVSDFRGLRSRHDLVHELVV